MAGPAAGELRYVAHKGTLSGLRCQFLSPGPGGEGRGGEVVPPGPRHLPGLGTLGQPLTHSGSRCPPWSVGSTPRSSKSGPCAAPCSRFT